VTFETPVLALQNAYGLIITKKNEFILPWTGAIKRNIIVAFSCEHGSKQELRSKK